MFCNTQFTHSQLQHLGLTKSFLLGDFAKHQQNVLFAQEQAMLPAAQAAVAHDRLIKDINQQIKDVSTQIKQLQALKADLIWHTKYQLQRQDPAHALDTTLQEHFIHRCAHYNCNGFVSSAWKCATCDKHTCAHCREPKNAHDDPAHVCNPDSVASVALLKNDTKPCPNCKVPVHKTEGCDQMFCTQCKRLWSWNTGRFETRGHNPHFLQWMRDNHPTGMPRDPNDVLCGREIDHHFLSQLNILVTHTLLHTPPHQHETLSHLLHNVYNFIGSIPHLRFHDLPRFNVDRTEINLHARKAFVSNAITLTRFKQTTHRNHILAIKHEHIAQLIQAVIQATTDIAFRFIHALQLHIQTHHAPPNTNSNTNTNTNYAHNFTSFYHELYNLHSYANHELNAIHHDFHSPPLQQLLFKHHSFKLFS
jgi:hypothetical protein